MMCWFGKMRFTVMLLLSLYSTRSNAEIWVTDEPMIKISPPIDKIVELSTVKVSCMYSTVNLTASWIAIESNGGAKVGKQIKQSTEFLQNALVHTGEFIADRDWNGIILACILSDSNKLFAGKRKLFAPFVVKNSSAVSLMGEATCLAKRATATPSLCQQRSSGSITTHLGGRISLTCHVSDTVDECQIGQLTVNGSTANMTDNLKFHRPRPIAGYRSITFDLAPQSTGISDYQCRCGSRLSPKLSVIVNRDPPTVFHRVTTINVVEGQGKAVRFNMEQPFELAQVQCRGGGSQVTLQKIGVNQVAFQRMVISSNDARRYVCNSTKAIFQLEQPMTLFTIPEYSDNLIYIDVRVHYAPMLRMRTRIFYACLNQPLTLVSDFDASVWGMRIVWSRMEELDDETSYNPTPSLQFQTLVDVDENTGYDVYMDESEPERIHVLNKHQAPRLHVSSLHLRSIGARDMGTYRMVVSNTAGSATFWAIVRPSDDCSHFLASEFDDQQLLKIGESLRRSLRYKQAQTSRS